MEAILPWATPALLTTVLGVVIGWGKKRDKTVENLTSRVCQLEQNWARIEGKLDLLIEHVQFKK